MRFNELDLNLLIALDALIDEQSVSAAADRVHLSQSAMSGALARLRSALGDEILLPRGRQMVLTPRAIELGESVKDVLARIERNVMARREFDPATSSRPISVMASDYAVSVGLAPAFRAMEGIAPLIRFEVLPIGGDPIGMLDRGEVRLLVIPEIYASADNPRKTLFEDDYVCVAWQGNPKIVGGLDVEALCSLQHVVVEFERQRAQSVFRWAQEHLGRPLKRAVTVSNYGVVPFLIVGTERIALMHARQARIYANMLPLEILGLPVDIPKIVEVIQWRKVNDTDEGLMWVVDTIARLAGSTYVAGNTSRSDEGTFA